MTVDRYARSARRTAGTSRRNSTSRTPAARAGRTIARGSRCTGRTSPARPSAYTFWDLQQQANRLSNALAALGVRARRQGRAHPAAAAGDRRRAHRRVPDRRGRGAAVVPVRSRGARIPARTIPRPRSRSSIRSRCPNLAADSRPLPGPWPRDRRRRARASRGSRRTKRCSSKASSRFTPVDTRRGRSGAPRLHERHHRPAQGRADAAAVPARQPAGLRPFARRLSAARATCSGRRPTGPGPAA